MSATPKIRSPRESDSLRVELGGWFKAYATGRGVMAVPLLVGLLLAAAVAKALLG